MLSPCWLSTEQCGLPSSIKRKLFLYDVIPEMNFTISKVGLLVELFVLLLLMLLLLDSLLLLLLVLLVLFVGGSTFCKALLPCWINSLNVLSVLLHCLPG